MRRYDLESPEKGWLASDLEREHARKGKNIVSISAARHRRDWNRNLHRLNGGGDGEAA